MSTSLIVIGSLNTDIIAAGISDFPASGEHVYGRELVIGPGGKSRNIADMAARLLPPLTVAMIGRTSMDELGLWNIPMEALKKSHVNIDYVHTLPYSTTHKFPGVAIIPVTQDGRNQIIVLPGISDDFSTDDIDEAQDLFEEVGTRGGLLAVTLECPIKTAQYAIRKAAQHNIRVVFDPGGIQRDQDLEELLSSGIFLIKPNEHEAQILTGVKVIDLASAKQAADILMKQQVQNVLITVGAKGAYFISAHTCIHIDVSKVEQSSMQDETGCGDQTIAAICSSLLAGKPLQESIEIGIKAGTLQFQRLGIQPISADELSAL
jgi:ribokinase